MNNIDAILSTIQVQVDPTSIGSGFSQDFYLSKKVVYGTHGRKRTKKAFQRMVRGELKNTNWVLDSDWTCSTTMQTEYNLLRARNVIQHQAPLICVMQRMPSGIARPKKEILHSGIFVYIPRTPGQTASAIYYEPIKRRSLRFSTLPRLVNNTAKLFRVSEVTVLRGKENCGGKKCLDSCVQFLYSYLGGNRNQFQPVEILRVR